MAHFHRPFAKLAGKGPPRNKWSILVEAIPGGCPDVRN